MLLRSIPQSKKLNKQLIYAHPCCITSIDRNTCITRTSAAGPKMEKVPNLFSSFSVCGGEGQNWPKF